MEIFEGALRITKNLDVETLDENEKFEVHAWLHFAFHVKVRTGVFKENNVSWSLEDIWNLHRLLIQEMIKEGLSHVNVDGLDAERLLLTDYGQPVPHVVDQLEEITLEDVLNYIKPIKLYHPFIYITGGIANYRKTKGDIDVLIKANEDDSVAKAAAFRFVRLFPSSIQQRIHFLYDSKAFIEHGPVTSHVPVFTVECSPITPFLRIEQSKQRLQLFLVGASDHLFDLCDGVMLNAYHISSKQIIVAKEWKKQNVRVILDNGAFADKTLTPEELLEVTRMLEPDVVCAPDFLYDLDSDVKSIEAQRKFLSMKPECKVMAIPQGQSAFKYEGCLKEIIKLNPDVIGIGRKSIQVAGYPGRGLAQRVFAMQRLEELGLFDLIKDNGIEMHALGMENPHVLKYLNYFGFSSIDSMGYIYSAMFGQLHFPYDVDEKSIKIKEEKIVPKESDTPELLEEKYQLFKKFRLLGSLEEKQRFILEKIWNPLRKQTAVQADIRRITTGLDISQRNDNPVLEKLSA